MICSKCKKDVPSVWHDCIARELSDGSSPSQSGSYGSGVRAQVFEVIVRQGMVDAPWREICVSAMQVNNIKPEEVQAEIDRRRGSGSGPLGSPVPKKPHPTKGSGSASLDEPE